MTATVDSCPACKAKNIAGENGLEMAQTFRPELVVTNALLPKIEGREIDDRMSDGLLDPNRLTELRELADGDRAFLDDLFATYIDQANEAIAALRSAFESSGRGAFSSAAHRLKGASLNVGAIRVAKTCQMIEVAMARELARPTSEQLSAIETDLNDTVAAFAGV